MGWRIEQKILFFCAKNFKNAKSAPNFLKFGLRLIHQTLCWAKEASANI